MNQEEINKQILERLEKIEKVVFGSEKIVKKSTKIDDLVLFIVNKISDCDEGEEIQSKVLDQKNMGAKILLCFYISYKYFKNAWLTTGDIEKITSSLGAKIAMGNVSNKIKEEIRKYLEGGAVRKKGQPTPYRLNRQGIKRFEKIIVKSN